MLNVLLSSPLAFIILASVLVIAISIHEFAHALMADYLGDPTPRSQGRVTLNPLAHLDPVGTIALLLVGFGWGKPVQFDPYNLKDRRRDTLLIALAGPASNIIMAFLLALALPWSGGLAQIFGYAIQINLVLATFNLLPVHPLDGGKILSGLLPKNLSIEFDDVMHRYGYIILLALVFLPVNGGSPVDYIVVPLMNLLQSVIIQGAGLITGFIH